MAFRKFITIAALGLTISLTACLGGMKTPVVDPVQENEFRRVVRLIRPLMEEEGILDANGAWHKARFSLGSGGTDDAGYRLLTRLSPAFRFPNTDPVYLGQTFADMLTEDARVARENHTVTVNQGIDRITLSLIASLDWDRNGKDDWLVICRIEPVNSVNKASREYYLLVPDPEAAIMNPRVLAIQDCREGHCELFRSAGKTSVLVDFNTTDLLPGEHAVTVPPSARQEARGRDNSNIEEHKLDQ